MKLTEKEIFYNTVFLYTDIILRFTSNYPEYRIVENVVKYLKNEIDIISFQDIISEHSNAWYLPTITLIDFLDTAYLETIGNDNFILDKKELAKFIEKYDETN